MIRFRALGSWRYYSRCSCQTSRTPLRSMWVASSWTTALTRSRRVAIRRWVRGDRSISSYATFLISMNTAAPSWLASLGKPFDRAPAESTAPISLRRSARDNRNLPMGEAGSPPAPGTNPELAHPISPRIRLLPGLVEPASRVTANPDSGEANSKRQRERSRRRGLRGPG